MGLRSFVALPVEKGGAIVRLQLERAQKSDIDSFISNAAYGFSAKQTLLLGLPYRLSASRDNRRGDVSLLYRTITWQQDRRSGTDRLGLLAGTVLSTEKERDNALQMGFVFTHVNDRNEIDIDTLYKSGMANRLDNGRYDLSWQYRLIPAEYPAWAAQHQLNSVLELNGRWREGMTMTQQLTIGLQWIQQKWVIEGGVVHDLNNSYEQRYILSTRFHF